MKVAFIPTDGIIPERKFTGNLSRRTNEISSTSADDEPMSNSPSSLSCCCHDDYYHRYQIPFVRKSSSPLTNLVKSNSKRGIHLYEKKKTREHRHKNVVNRHNYPSSKSPQLTQPPSPHSPSSPIATSTNRLASTMSKYPTSRSPRPDVKVITNCAKRYSSYLGRPSPPTIRTTHSATPSNNPNYRYRDSPLLSRPSVTPPPPLVRNFDSTTCTECCCTEPPQRTEGYYRYLQPPQPPQPLQPLALPPPHLKHPYYYPHFFARPFYYGRFVILFPIFAGFVIASYSI